MSATNAKRGLAGVHWSSKDIMASSFLPSRKVFSSMPCSLNDILMPTLTASSWQARAKDSTPSAGVLHGRPKVRAIS